MNKFFEPGALLRRDVMGTVSIYDETYHSCGTIFYGDVVLVLDVENADEKNNIVSIKVLVTAGKGNGMGRLHTRPRYWQRLA
jgi:hypothetical protein